jgi:hypothetical protein
LGIQQPEKRFAMHETQPPSCSPTPLFPNRGNRAQSRFINTEPTFALHQQLAERVTRHKYNALLVEAEAMLRAQGVTLEGGHKHPLGLTAFRLDRDSWEKIAALAEQFSPVIEQAIDWVLEDSQRLERFCPEHRRLYPYLKGTAGALSWQIISRFDAIITPEGDLKIIELNTGGPGGLMLSKPLSQATATYFSTILGEPGHQQKFGAPDPQAIVEELLALETASGIPKGDVGILYDEGHLHMELDLYARAFREQGRRAHIIYAGDLAYHDGALYWGKQRLSMTYNKFRISTENSERIGWKPGFEQRYWAFLEAHKRSSFVSVNNLCSLTIPEDKAFLHVFFDEHFRDTLSPTQRLLIDNHLLWTTKLESKEISLQGQRINLLNWAKKLKDQLVIKPANESRGYKVSIGCECTSNEWNRAVDAYDQAEPMVVQQYAAPLTLPVPVLGRHDEPARIELMYHTLALAMVQGKFHGVISRVSTDLVTNVMKRGYGQAVFIE